MMRAEDAGGLRERDMIWVIQMEKEEEQNELCLTFDAECVAVPEVHTGLVETCDELECEACPVFYDEVAVPEIRFGAAGVCCRPKKRPGADDGPQAQ